MSEEQKEESISQLRRVQSSMTECSVHDRVWLEGEDLREMSLVGAVTQFGLHAYTWGEKDF